MMVTVTTHRDEATAIRGISAVEVYSRRVLSDAVELIAHALEHRPYPPCPHSGYVKPMMKDLFVRFEILDIPNWSLVMPAMTLGKLGHKLVLKWNT